MEHMEPEESRAAEVSARFLVDLAVPRDWSLWIHTFGYHPASVREGVQVSGAEVEKRGRRKVTQF